MEVLEKLWDFSLLVLQLELEFELELGGSVELESVKVFPVLEEGGGVAFLAAGGAAFLEGGGVELALATALWGLGAGLDEVDFDDAAATCCSSLFQA